MNNLVLIIVLIVFALFMAGNVIVILTTMRGRKHDKKFEDELCS